MAARKSKIRTTLRIPGTWREPAELLERLPREFRLTPEALVLPDGTAIEFNPVPPDAQFADIFQSSCRHPAGDEVMESVRRYTVNACLSGPGGSLDAAWTMMQAGAALVRAGGAGIFIDNCALAHAGAKWLEMAEDGSPDALSFAFVSIVRGGQEIWTVGMHVLGQPDILMQLRDLGEGEDQIIELIVYLAAGEKQVGDGHILAGLDGPRYRATAVADEKSDVSHPVHNPLGRLKLVSIKDIAESN